MDKTEAAWAAGFIDGEGHFGRTNSKGGPNRRLVIAVAQVHREPLDRLQGLFGGTVYGPYPSQHEKGHAYYQWNLAGHEAVSQAAAAMRPYMCGPKWAQAQAALDGYAEWLRIKALRHLPRPACSRGHAFTAANTLLKADGRRRCRACRDLYARANRARHREYEKKYDASELGHARRKRYADSIRKS